MEKGVVAKLVLLIPRLTLKPEVMSLVMGRYLSPNTTWSYLRENATESVSGLQFEQEFTISSGIINPKHVFFY